MDYKERLKRLPPDGTVNIITDNKNYNSNIMILRCPEHLRSSTDPEFHFANIDRNKIGTNYSGNVILEKLLPGLPKVKTVEVPEVKEDTPPPPKKNYPRVQKVFHRPRRSAHVSSGSRPQYPQKKRWIERSWSEPKASWSEPKASWSEPKPSWSESKPSWSESKPSWSEPKPSWSEPKPSWSEPKPSWSEPKPSWSEPKPLAAEISPWEPGKQPWKTTVLAPGLPVLTENVPMNVDYPDVVDYFDPLNEKLPFTPDYTDRSERIRPDKFCRGPSPQYTPNTGLLGDHPISTHVFRTQRGKANSYSSVPRNAGIERNKYRNKNPRNNAMDKSFRGTARPQARSFPNRKKKNNQKRFKSERNEAHFEMEPRPVNMAQGWNQPYNRGRSNFRSRQKFN